jgi:hypothetical protein
MKITKTATVAAGLVTAATLLAALPALAADDFHWQGRLAQGRTLEIKGVNGGIVAEGASAGVAEVTAWKRAKKSDPAQVKIEVVEHAGGVTICAVYPSRDGSANVCAPGEGGHISTRDNDVQVEFRVKVPASVRFVGRTVNGGITATGLQADAELATVNGGVAVETAGTARARAVNGGISAHLGRADWTGLLKLETVNGGVEVVLPAGTNAEVEASTVNGGIESDFPIAVTGLHHGGRRRLHGTIGSGGRQLEISAVNGAIALRKAGARS